MTHFGLTLLTLGTLFSSVSLMAIQGEYHWTLCETSPAAVKKQLSATVAKSSRRYVYYLDTKHRELLRAGVILRLRGEVGEIFQATVKVTTRPGKVPDSFQDEKGFKCEADYQGRAATIHCSFSKETADISDLKEVLNGELGADTLFKKQKKYLDAMGVRVSWDDLAVVGPVDNLKWKLKASVANADLELMTSNSGASLLQLSSKEDPSSSAQFLQISAALISHGIRLCPKQIGTAPWALGMN